MHFTPFSPLSVPRSVSTPSSLSLSVPLFPSHSPLASPQTQQQYSLHNVQLPIHFVQHQSSCQCTGTINDLFPQSQRICHHQEHLAPLPFMSIERSNRHRESCLLSFTKSQSVKSTNSACRSWHSVKHANYHSANNTKQKRLDLVPGCAPSCIHMSASSLCRSTCSCIWM